MSDSVIYVLVGYSGHGLVVTDTARDNGLSLIYYADRQEVTNNPFDLIYTGNEGDADFAGWQKGWRFLLGVGDNHKRERIALNLFSHNECIETLVHKNASVSGTAIIGHGTFVARGVCINAFAYVADYVILNTGCQVDHGCRIENGVHIAPGAVLAGDVKVGRRSFVGANAVIRQGITIGDDIVIGAGAVVIKDILKPGTYAGNPARLISHAK